MAARRRRRQVRGSGKLWLERRQLNLSGRYWDRLFRSRLHACTLRALESASAGALAGPDESGARGEKASAIALSMELPISTIEFFVSTAASAGIASASDVDSAISIQRFELPFKSARFPCFSFTRRFSRLPAEDTWGCATTS